MDDNVSKREVTKMRKTRVTWDRRGFLRTAASDGVSLRELELDADALAKALR